MFGKVPYLIGEEGVRALRARDPLSGGKRDSIGEARQAGTGAPQQWSNRARPRIRAPSPGAGPAFLTILVLVVKVGIHAVFLESWGKGKMYPPYTPVKEKDCA